MYHRLQASNCSVNRDYPSNIIRVNVSSSDCIAGIFILIEKSFKHRTNDGVAILLQERGFEGSRVQVVQEALS